MDQQIRDFIPEDRDAYIRLSGEFYRSKAVDHRVPEAFFQATFVLLVN